MYNQNDPTLILVMSFLFDSDLPYLSNWSDGCIASEYAPR